MIISAKYLPRDLRIIGGLAVLFALLQLPGLGREEKLIYIATFTRYLSAAIIYFSLAAGVSRKEKWAWLSEIIIFILSIIGGLTSALFGLVSPLFFVLSILIPIIFLITFTRARKEIAISSKISTTPLIFLAIGFVMNVISTGYLLI